MCRIRRLLGEQYRSAEKLRDPLFFPIIKEIIFTHRNDEEIREAAYFIMARLLSHALDAETIAFYIDRVEKEADRNVRFRMLTHLRRVTIPPSQPMDALIALTQDAHAQVCCAAIGVLGCQDSLRCRQALRDIISREDHKACRDEIVYAQAAL